MTKPAAGSGRQIFFLGDDPKRSKMGRKCTPMHGNRESFDFPLLRPLTTDYCFAHCPLPTASRGSVLAKKFKLQIYQDRQLICSESFDQAVDLGRQRTPAEPLWAKLRDGEQWRMAVARMNETGVSRTHVRLRPSSDQLIQIENHSSKNPVFLSTGDSIDAGATRELFVPFVLSIGDKAIRAEWVEEEEDAGYQSLIAPTVQPETIDRRGGEPFVPALHLLPDGDRESVVRWLQTVIGVLQNAAGSNDFFQRAAQGMINIVGLDSGGVLLHKAGLWEMAALRRRGESSGERRPGSRAIRF